jgi:hypothetical protein
MRLRPIRAVLVVLLATIAVAVLAVGLALEPLATWRTRKALAGLEGMTSRFTAVRVSLRDLSYEIQGLRIEKRAAQGKALPFFEARRIRLGLLGREILRGHLVGRVDLEAPRLNLVQRSDTEGPGESARPDVDAGAGKNPRAHAAGQEIQETPALGRKLSELTPFLLDRVQVRRGEILWVDAREPTHPTLGFHDIEATLENFASRPALARGEPTVLAARGIIQRTGKASIFATADPLAKKLTFAGQGRVRGLALAELGDLIGAKSDVAPDQGTIDMALRFRAEGGHLSGGIRPILRGAGTRASKPGLAAKLKSFLADTSLNIFKDDVPGRHAVATTIPIEGRVDDPNLQLVPTIIGVIRNAFVRGVSDSLQGLPPPKAKEQQSTLEQARRALGKGRPPRAQPEGKPR